MYYKIMIWANVTKFGQNFMAPQIFLAGTAMATSLWAVILRGT